MTGCAYALAVTAASPTRHSNVNLWSHAVQTIPLDIAVSPTESSGTQCDLSVVNVTVCFQAPVPACASYENVVVSVTSSSASRWTVHVNVTAVEAAMASLPVPAGVAANVTVSVAGDVSAPGEDTVVLQSVSEVVMPWSGPPGTGVVEEIPSPALPTDAFDGACGTRSEYRGTLRVHAVLAGNGLLIRQWRCAWWSHLLAMQQDVLA